MTSLLAQKECIPYRGGVPPLKGDDLKSLLSQLGGGWIVVEEHHLEKLFRSRDLLEREVFAAQAAGCL